MSDEEIITEVRGEDLLRSCEAHQRKQSALKRKHQQEQKSISKDEDKSPESPERDDSLPAPPPVLDPEEEDLEGIVFGRSAWIDSDDEADKPSKASSTSKPKKARISRRSGESDDSSDEVEQRDKEDDEREEPEQRKPAWVDEDDEQLAADNVLSGPSTLSSKLRDVHEKIFSRPKWAVQSEKKRKLQARSDEADRLLRTASTYIDSDASGRPLPSGLLDFTRCPQMNKFCFQHSPLVAVGFHPAAEIAMAAHKSGVVTFLSVGAKQCNKIQSVLLKNFDISCAKLSHDGSQMMAGSIRYRTLHCYDLMSGNQTQVTFPKAHELTHMKRFEVSSCGRFIAIHGRFGNIYVISAETKQQICTLKMNEDVTSTVFAPDGRLLSHGGNYVYLWDIGSRRCVQKFLDDGCLKGQTMALSPDARLLATGCDSGIVNVYDAQQMLKGGSSAPRTPKPLKCVNNLVTPITSLAFNPTSEILVAASRYKPEAVKMVHTSSLTVFSNFPNAQHRFHNPSSVAFSPNGGFLALGATVGAASLVRLNHYGSY